MFTISLCQASYKSGSQSIKVRDLWISLAKFSFRVEHCLGFEENDESILKAYTIDKRTNLGTTLDNKTKFITTPNLSTPSGTRNWNAAATISTGKFILLIADDLIPEFGWDVSIEEFINEKKVTNGIFKFTDNRCQTKKHAKNDILIPRHPGMLRETYTKLGYVFDPLFNSVGPDLDLLIYGLTNGSLYDLRKIKFHHSIGRILNSNLDLNCGCFSNLSNIKTESTLSQKRMHSENTEDIIKLIINKWGRLNFYLAKLACNTKFSNFLIKSVKLNKKNISAVLIFSCIIKFLLSKFISPSFGYRKII
jgi:hypothetical protein